MFDRDIKIVIFFKKLIKEYMLQLIFEKILFPLCNKSNCKCTILISFLYYSIFSRN